jgi:hypothetical protein
MARPGRFGIGARLSRHMQKMAENRHFFLCLMRACHLVSRRLARFRAGRARSARWLHLMNKDFQE